MPCHYWELLWALLLFGDLFELANPQNGGGVQPATAETLKKASFSGQSMTDSFYPNKQSSRQGKAAITIFVKPEAKAAIRAALADGGYGTSYQEGIVNLLKELLNKQNRKQME